MIRMRIPYSLASPKLIALVSFTQPINLIYHIYVQRTYRLAFASGGSHDSR